MNILAVMPWYPANATRFLPDAFERAGANVFRVGPCYFSHGNADWASHEYPKVDLALPRGCPWQIDHYIDQATKAGISPHMVIISEETYHNPIFNTDKIPSAFWSLDGWPENFERVEMVRPTMAYMNHPYGIRLHPRQTLDPRWAYLPGACAPWVHQDFAQIRDIDFCIFGTMYGKRPYLLEETQKAGLRTLGGFVNTKSYVEGHNRTLATYHNTNAQEDVKARLFEYMAMGCIVLSGPTRLLEVLGYLPNVHYLPVREEYKIGEDEPWATSNEIRRNITYLKEHASFSQQMRADAQQFTLNHHTHYHRAHTIASDLCLPALVGMLSPYCNA